MTRFVTIIDFRAVRRRNTPGRQRERHAHRERCPRCGERLVTVAGRLVCLVAACRLSSTSSPTPARSSGFPRAQEN